jgi:hypothetical protein
LGASVGVSLLLRLDGSHAKVAFARRPQPPTERKGIRANDGGHLLEGYREAAQRLLSTIRTKEW